LTRYCFFIASSTLGKTLVTHTKFHQCLVVQD
jgi:hypothetical protein